jgi:hypothetical protein
MIVYCRTPNAFQQALRTRHLLRSKRRLRTLPCWLKEIAEDFMNHINYKEALQVLRRAGLTTTEVDRLCDFCRKHAASEMDRAAIDQRHLEFVRWLVTTHRLSDQIDADSHTCG